MVTWCCTSFFALYLVVPFFKALYRVIRHQDRFYLMEAPIFISVADRQSLSGNDLVSPLSSLISLRTDTSKLDERETFKLAAFFVVIWFGANYSINAGLSLTSVSSATILATTSGLFCVALPDSMIEPLDRLLHPPIRAYAWIWTIYPTQVVCCLIQVRLHLNCS
jgi:solute carrier family 35 protein F5